MKELLNSIEDKNLLSLADFLSNLTILNEDEEQVLNKNKDFCLKALNYSFKSKKEISEDLLSWSYFQLLNDKVSYPFLVNFFDNCDNSRTSLIQKITQRYLYNIQKIFHQKRFFGFFEDKELLGIDYFEKMIAYPLKTNFIHLLNDNSKLIIIDELKKLDSFYNKKQIKIISKIINLIELIEKSQSNSNKFQINKTLPDEVIFILKEIEKNYNFLKTIEINEIDKIKVENFWNNDIHKIIESFNEYENLKKETKEEIKHFSGKTALDFTLSSLDEINKYLKSLLINQQEEMVKDLSIQNRYTKMRKD